MAQNTAWLEIGAPAAFTGLVESRYNDQLGEIVGFLNDRVVVRLPKIFGAVLLKVSPRNLKPLADGTIVALKNLTSNESLNGQIGTTVSCEFSQQKYTVELREGQKLVKSIKMEARSRLWDANLAGGIDWLQWRKEQVCLFIDSTRNHRKYSLHLPLGFSRQMREAKSLSDVRPWPVLLYMHGTGGSSFFTHSKKTLKSIGLQYAATNFVVVSPNCDWTWKDQPGRWVGELMMALRAAHWIDHRRIYLTGCSMGGMSTWEIGASFPELFAAIAPVAAHHQEAHTPDIARRLRDKPVLAVASLHDDTCPHRLEDALWRALRTEGSSSLVVAVAQQIDHCSMFERTYCDDTVLYDWLLRHEHSP